MASPQRNYEPPREPAQRPGETWRMDPAPVRQGGRGWFWIWIVLFIAAIVWFCGWGWGGYGGWWWGRSHGAVVQPAPAGTLGTGTGQTTGNNGTANTAPAKNGNAGGAPAAPQR